MEGPLPFGFPPATAGYLALYLVTLAVHGAGVGYVLAGAAFLTGHAVREGRPSAIPRLFRDWLPMGISVAITAAIAPLLFLQVLYRNAYYTANLLLFHRWMSILPVLIAGFYLAYLLKGHVLAARPRLRLAAAAVMTSCFVWTAWAFTENHLLSIAPQATQVTFYAEGRVFHRSAELLPRLVMAVAGAVSVGCAIVAWQLRGGAPLPGEDRAGDWRRLATVAMASLAVAIAGGAAHGALLGPRAASLVMEGEIAGHGMSRPWVLLLAASAAAVLSLWVRVRRRAAATRGVLALLAGATATMVVAAAAVREAFRIQTLGAEAMTQLAERHARSATAAGLPVFVACALLAAVAIGVIVRAMRRSGGP